MDAPTFEEQGGTVVVTFRAHVALGPEVTPQVTPQVLAVLEALLEAGWLEMTIPDKPRSSKQRYRTTEAGKKVLAEAGHKG